MNAPLIFAITLISCQLANGQPQLTDDMIRRLGGDPVALREQESKRQKEAPNPEEVALQERAADMAKTITPVQIASLRSDDPLLTALYAYRVGWIDDAKLSWAPVIDQDVRQRKEAAQLMKSIFLTGRQHSIRINVMWWLDKHRDVKWGDEIMEEAIKLYRADPKKWDYSGVTMLRRLVAGRGNESHLPFFDELDKTEFGSGNDRGFLEHRIEIAKEKATSESSTKKAVFPISQLPKPTHPTSLGQGQKQPPSNEANRIEWLAVVVVVIVAGGLAWLLLKGRK